MSYKNVFEFHKATNDIPKICVRQILGIDNEIEFVLYEMDANNYSLKEYDGVFKNIEQVMKDLSNKNPSFMIVNYNSNFAI
jgi:hypothetical protein